MKRLKMIRFSEAKELTKGEQKNLRGGTDGLTLACKCKCDGSTGEWLLYTSTGECSTLGSRPSEWCPGTATCWPQ
jgi:hypothetical protein